MNESERSGGGYIADAWLVILLALLYGGALAGVQTRLGPRIAENKRNETYDQIPQLVPGAVKEKIDEVSVHDASGRETTVYKAFDAAGKLRGWVLPAIGQGFADRIELLIGLDPKMSVITGLFVLEQKETPGLGDHIRGDDFRNQFRGKATTVPLVVVTGTPAADNQLRAITGATISSRSVAELVNQTIAKLRQQIMAGDH